MADAFEVDERTAPRFLTMDRRIPEAVRQLVEEADGCLNMNFGTGGSACIRRGIRKKFEIEDVDAGDWAASVQALAAKHQGVAPTPPFTTVRLLNCFGTIRGWPVW